MKRKLTILLWAMLPVVAAYADDYPYLVLRTADGNQVAMDVASLKFTFSDGQLLAVNEAGSQTFTLSSLSTMWFAQTDATGLEAVDAAGTGNGVVEAFSLQGVRLGQFASVQAMRKALPEGVYIVKSNGQARKVTVGK